MSKPELKIIGSIDVVEPGGEKENYPMALLIEFDSADEIRAAIQNGYCEFDFGEDG